ncbi:SPOR domain-containing protein, partial [Azorhizobium caulinodans]
EADALGSFKVLQSRYPQLLGTYKASVKKADLGERGIYYRAQVGPFTTREQANDLCQSLRAQGADCLVQKN